MKEILTIVNPAAGGGRCAARARWAIHSLQEAGLRLRVERTSAPGHATTLARDGVRSGFTRFLAFGGDGTAFEVLNGMMDPNGSPHSPLTLGTIPMGTGNSFLRDFSIMDARGAIHAVIQGDTRTCDVIRATHADGVLHYINLLSVAFSARAGALTNERFKHLGAPGYILAVLLSVIRLTYPLYSIRLDSGPVDRRRAALLSFSNSRYTGGDMMMAPRADPTDGEMDVIRVGEMGRLRFVATFPRIFQGTHVESPDVEQTRARLVTFVDPERQDVMVDGEVLNLELHSLEVLPGALRIWA